MTDDRERRYGGPHCTHVWRINKRTWSVRASFGEFEVTEDSSRAFTNPGDGKATGKETRHREWAIYVCALCDRREAVEVSS